jgi:hypothetical protein
MISLKDINYIRTQDYQKNVQGSLISNAYIYVYFANKEDNQLRIVFSGSSAERAQYKIHSNKLMELFKYYNEKI